MDSSNIFWKFCSPAGTPYTFNPYVPPCERNPYYDDPRDVGPNHDSTPINLVQCERCGTYFASPATPSRLLQTQRHLCDECRAETDSQ